MMTSSLLTLRQSAGIGLGPSGQRVMDMIDEDFRRKYEAVCVGNKPADQQHVFFEGLLLKEGLGIRFTLLKNKQGIGPLISSPQVSTKTGTAAHPGVTLITPAKRFVSILNLPSMI